MRLTNAITVGPFTLDAPIRSGGMGTIWGGVHTDSGEQVAVKVLTWSRAREPEFVEAFEHEARAIAALDHPAIVRIYDYGVLDDAADRASAGALASGSPYLVMPLADGSLDTEGHIGDWPALKQLLEALLEALAHAHARGVVHRDIKPANVLLSGDRIILSDFGLAHPMVPTNEGPLPAAVGTPWYMAPEQFTGEWREFGPWTDLYALGILGWRFACGERPYQGDSVAQLAEQHMKEVLPALRPCFALPDGFDAWLQRLTTKEPEDRFQRAADAAAALARLGEPSLHNVLPSGIWRPLVSSEPDSWADTMVDPTSPVAARLDGRVDPKHPTRIEAPSIPASWRLESDQAGHGLLQGAGLGLFALRSLPLVGRDSERDVLWGHLSDVLSQRTPTVVCLRGAAGTGKSRLADWLQTRAHELGVADTFRAVHSPLAGPGDGLGGMVARQLGCVGLERGPLTEGLEARVRRQGTTNPHEWRGLAELMQPSGLRDTGRFKF
ncbi:MAG: serine/threonine protein kinase, partial [Myxococcota bacterium]